MEKVIYHIRFVRAMLFVLAMVTAGSCSSQQEVLQDMQSSFVALIVEDIDTSISWYTQKLGFRIIDHKVFDDMGFKQANLAKGTNRLELIELDNALSAVKVVPNYNSKTRMVGIFKFGYSISNFDKAIEQLRRAGVIFQGTAVEDEHTGKKMIIIKDPDGNRIQIFEN